MNVKRVKRCRYINNLGARNVKSKSIAIERKFIWKSIFGTACMRYEIFREKCYVLKAKFRRDVFYSEYS